MNESIKETENLLLFFQYKVEFYFTDEHQNLYFHSCENTAFGVHSVK